MDKNIVLIGFMGTGKSLTAKELGKRLKWECISTDNLIENGQGKPISRIFSETGEKFFRELEQTVVQEIHQKRPVIIDCGGGIVLNSKNIDLLKINGVIVCLTSTPDAIYQRTKDKPHRPLLSGCNPKERIAELLKERELFYRRADHTIDTTHLTIVQIADKVIEIIGHD